MALIEKKFGKINEGEIVLVLISPQKYVETNLELLKYLQKMRMRGVYITINKPHSVLCNLFKKNKVDCSSIFFIDCVSELIHSDTSRSKNVVFVSPKNLTGISIAISELIKSIEGRKYVFIDSLSTLLIYNSLGSLNKFSHFLTNRFRSNGVTSVFLSLEGDLDPSFLSTMSKFCDRVIKLG
ncbi:MAG: hypothetical protein ABH803_00100 [Candidatus Micrarchaeota archaeon]